MNCQPQPHAKRLPHIRSVSTATKQRSSATRLPGCQDSQAPGITGKQAPSQPAATDTLNPPRAALASRGTHTVCFNDWDSLFKTTVCADDG